MLLVVAVDGNAQLEGGDGPLAETQKKYGAAAVEALAPLTREHDLVMTHGNGPQVGLLANERALDLNPPCPFPLGVPGAQLGGGSVTSSAGFREHSTRTAGDQPDLPDRRHEGAAPILQRLSPDRGGRRASDPPGQGMVHNVTSS
jgi:hypothetical protein